MSKPYDYAEMEGDLRSNAAILEGRRVIAIYAQVVDPEINQVFFHTDSGWVVVTPRIGGEVIGLSECEAPQDLTLVAIAEQWSGYHIAQVRTIGHAWNGHGIEIGFVGSPTKTMLISSVECAENSTRASDALRVGIGAYVIESVSR